MIWEDYLIIIGTLCGISAGLMLLGKFAWEQFQEWGFGREYEKRVAEENRRLYQQNINELIVKITEHEIGADDRDLREALAGSLTAYRCQRS